MNSWKQLISDGSEGLPPSVMRVGFLIVVVPVMIVWTVLSIMKGEFIAPPAGILALVGSAFAGKSFQSLAENFTGVHFSPTVSVPLPQPQIQNGESRPGGTATTKETQS